MVGPFSRAKLILLCMCVYISKGLSLNLLLKKILC